MEYDLIIIGGGIAGLYAAYQICKSNKSFIILEKNSSDRLGGRVMVDKFYGANILCGAGIGRTDTNPLLLKLAKQLNIPCKKFIQSINYADNVEKIDLMQYIQQLRKQIKSNPILRTKTFKQAFTKVFDKKQLEKFVTYSGYSDYLDADVDLTIRTYGMDDCIAGWEGFRISWQELIDKLIQKIGTNHIATNTEVVDIIQSNNLYNIRTSHTTYIAKKVLLCLPINQIQKLSPHPIYQQIVSQPFLRVIAKFDSSSAKILAEITQSYTVVANQLQKIIPIDLLKGIWMICYSDNQNALQLKNNLSDTLKNCSKYARLAEEALNIPSHTLQIISIRSYWWNQGTHYMKPLSKQYKSRKEFLKIAQHPQPNMWVGGEAVSDYQGWVEGALKSIRLIEKYL